MRTAIRTDSHTRVSRCATLLAAIALSVGATACDDPAQERAELQRDHERCLVSERHADGEVRYTDYQDCMSMRGWSDPDLTHRG
jgi:hypothetical protein